MRMQLPQALVIGGVTAVLLLGACGSSDSDAQDDEATSSTTLTTEATSTSSTAGTAAAPTTTAAAVTVKQFQFMPPELVVRAGTKVTWTNQDQILHTATAGATPGTADGKFDGPMDGVGQSFSFTFDQPGTYPYFCRRHDSMTGTIVVQ